MTYFAGFLLFTCIVASLASFATAGDACDEVPYYTANGGRQCNNDYTIDQKDGTINYTSSYCCRGKTIGTTWCISTGTAGWPTPPECPRKDGSPTPCKWDQPATPPLTKSYGMSYCKKYPDESKLMCLPDDPNFIGLVPLSKTAILTVHNCWRKNLSPPAKSPIPVLQWDDYLAAMAERWAAQCDQYPTDYPPHTPNDMSFVPNRGADGSDYPAVGQNICHGYQLNECMDSWAAEWNDWTYGVGQTDPTDKKAQIGHYTQMVASTSEYIGCAVAKCKNLTPEYLTVCNYAPTGNIVGDDIDTEKKPYDAVGTRRRRKRIFAGRRHFEE